MPIPLKHFERVASRKKLHVSDVPCLGVLVSSPLRQLSSREFSDTPYKRRLVLLIDAAEKRRPVFFVEKTDAPHRHAVCVYAEVERRFSCWLAQLQNLLVYPVWSKPAQPCVAPRHEVFIIVKSYDMTVYGETAAPADVRHRHVDIACLRNILYNSRYSALHHRKILVGAWNEYVYFFVHDIFCAHYEKSPRSLTPVGLYPRCSIISTSFIFKPLHFFV